MIFTWASVRLVSSIVEQVADQEVEESDIIISFPCLHDFLASHLLCCGWIRLFLEGVTSLCPVIYIPAVL